MDTLLKDLRYAVRRLLESPGFTAIALLTLALGIGANSAIFSVVNTVLLRPLEYRAPHELVYIHSQFPTLGFDEFWISPPEYRELQARARSYSGIGAWRTGSASLSGIENPERVTAAVASAELFSTLGVPARLGRPFSKEEDTEGVEPVVVISERIWESAYGSDQAIVGRQIEVDGALRTVVGVMPAGFDVQDAGVDVWIPLGLPPSPENRGNHFLHLVGRLAPGVTLAQAGSEMRTLVAHWEELAGGRHAPSPEFHAMVVKSLSEEVVGGIRPALLVLLGAVGFVLLIACANVANLLLARAEARQREIAVRSALGAGRGRLVRQFLTESVLLALLGGALGLLLGYWSLEALLAVNPDSLPRTADIGLELPVLVFTAVVSLLTGLLFGLAPLLHLSDRVVALALRDGGQRSTATAGRQRLRRLLVVSEVALAVILLIGASLLLRSLAALQQVDPGFDPGGLLTFELHMPESRYPDGEHRAAFLDRLAAGLESLPGVEGAAAMTGLPPIRDVSANDTDFEGKQPTEDGPAFNVDYYQMVHGDYFETMRIPIRQGRGFAASDDAAATPVAVINERLARVFYPGENPLGRRIRQCCGDDEPWSTIVGIAADVKQGGLSEDTGTELYFHYPQAVASGTSARTMNVVVRTSRAPLALAEEVRRVVWSLDRSLPLAHLQTMDENLAGSLSRPRFLSLLLTIFAGVALLLAAIGTYGVLSYSVVERNREIGVRMALGAGARSVMAMILRDGLSVAGIGLALGLLGAVALTRLLTSLLFGVSSMDLAAFLIAPLVLAVVAVVACYLPARRATRVDPMVALRAD